MKQSFLNDALIIFSRQESSQWLNALLALLREFGQTSKLSSQQRSVKNSDTSQLSFETFYGQQKTVKKLFLLITRASFSHFKIGNQMPCATALLSYFGAATEKNTITKTFSTITLATTSTRNEIEIDSQSFYLL